MDAVEVAAMADAVANVYIPHDGGDNNDASHNDGGDALKTAATVGVADAVAWVVVAEVV